LLLFGALAGICYFLAASWNESRFEILVPLLVLVALATHREVFFTDETAVNSSIIVVCCSFSALATHGSLVGPLACGILAGVHFAHLRNRVLSKLVVNTAATGLAALAGALVLTLITDSNSSFTSVVMALPFAVAAYWLIDNLLIALVVATVTGESAGSVAHKMFRAESGMVIAGIMGGLCGVVVGEMGPGVGLGLLVCLLLVADVRRFVGQSRARRVNTLASRGVLPLLAVSVAYFAAQWDQWLAVAWLVVGVPLLTYLLALVRVRARISRWDRHLAIGVAVLEVPLVLSFGLAGAIAHWVGVEVGLFTAGGLAALLTLCARYFRRRELRARADDRRVAVAAERAVLEGRSLPTPV